MSAAVCPYCRGAIEADEARVVLCPGCGAPHHADCFEENGGCTVFGCSAAPAAEPKLSISSPDLQQTEITGALPPAPSVAVPPPPLPGSTGAPPPPLPPPSTPPPSALPEAPPLFSSTGYNQPVHPLPDPRPPSEEMFTTLGYRRPQPTPYPAPQPAYLPPRRPFDAALPQKNRTTFLLLGVLLGPLGAHSFYAGSRKKGFVQLGITVLTLGLAALMVWIWAVIDICTISTDSEGIPFRN